MARIISGTLIVPGFTNIGAGEWTFQEAVYSTVSDATGTGVGAITTGFIVYVPGADSEFNPLTGVMHRYKLTAISNKNAEASKFDGTILWDEGGDEVDQPQNGCFCIISEASANKHLGCPVSQQNYSDLGAGQDMYALVTDARSVIDPN